MTWAYFSTVLLYIDPGSGSYLVQLLVAGVLGAGYAVKLYWAKVKSFFTGKNDSPDADDEPDGK